MSEETRAEAERISADLGYQGGWQNQQALTEAIDKGLQARDERAARIAAKCEINHCWRMHGPRLSCGCPCHWVIVEILNKQSSEICGGADVSDEK